MKTINLLSAFCLCALFIFSANGMEDEQQLGLEESVRIVPSKTGAKGWYAGFTDYFSGYENNTQKALTCYLELETDALPKENQLAAQNYLNWSVEDETIAMTLLITRIQPFLTNKNGFPLEPYLNIIKRTSNLKKLINGGKKHGLELSQINKQNSYRMVTNILTNTNN